MVAIILGMVLGGISEVKPRAAMAAGRTLRDLVDRPKAAIIFDLILLILVLRVRTLIRGPKAKRGPGPGARRRTFEPARVVYAEPTGGTS